MKYMLAAFVLAASIAAAADSCGCAAKKEASKNQASCGCTAKADDNANTNKVKSTCCCAKAKNDTAKSACACAKAKNGTACQKTKKAE